MTMQRLLSDGRKVKKIMDFRVGKLFAYQRCRCSMDQKNIPRKSDEIIAESMPCAHLYHFMGGVITMDVGFCAV